MRTTPIIAFFLLVGISIAGVIGVQAATDDIPEERAEAINDLQEEIEQKAAEIQQLEEAARRYQAELQEARTQKQSLQQELDIIDAQVRKLQADIAVTQARINSATLHITRLNASIREKEQEIATLRERMAAIMRALYQADGQTLLELTLRYEALSDALQEVYALNKLSDALTSNLTAIRAVKEELQDDRAATAERREEQEEFYQQLAAQEEIVAERRAARQNLLEETRGREQEYQQLLTEAEQKRRQIEQQIFELEDKLRRTLDPDAVPAPRPGVLEWPTEGIITQPYGCVTTRFAQRIYPNCTDERGRAGGFHNGLDVASGAGTPIRAARDGTVIAVHDAPFAYGKWVAIEHDNGLVTGYTHMSRQNVSVGQAVAEGDIVGFMGTTGLSTGDHLHFLVYVAATFTTKPSSIQGVLPIGATLNPMDYL